MKPILFCLATLAISSNFLPAQSTAPTGSIVGNADPGAQIVVTGTDDGSVSGTMATCDGTYKAEKLKPGRYSIVEGGPHHAVRRLSVVAGTASHVDLGSATAEASQACRKKTGDH